MTTVVAILVAAGRGLRAGGATPKQFAMVGGQSVLWHAVDAFARHPLLDHIVVVIGAEDRQAYDRALQGQPSPKLLEPALGGTTRQESVHSGLRGFEQINTGQDAIVLVHDAARPFVPQEMITRAIAAAKHHGAAVPVLPVSDTLKLVDPDGIVRNTVDRTTLRIIQTPQSFHLPLLRAAHDKAALESRNDFTDDAAVCEWAGQSIKTFEGAENAFKITTSGDLERAARTAIRLAGVASPARFEVRTATGYDVHAFGDGSSLWLGGIEIPFERGLIGHSDADPLLHAMTDAVLGALGDGDIGMHFPPSDERWRGARSEIFLQDALRRVAERGGRVLHLDGTIICEAPRLSPHRDAMRSRIAEIAGVSEGRIGLKATTTEKLGFTGRREGIAALATATLELPSGDES